MSVETFGGGMMADAAMTTTAAVDADVDAAAAASPTSSVADPFCHELRDDLARSLQKRKRQLLIEHGWKIQSFGQELEGMTTNIVRNLLSATRSTVKGSRHDETVRQSIKTLSGKVGQLSAAESSLASAEKMLNIHSSVRLASVDTIPFKLSVISSSIRTVAEQQQKVDLITERLREAMDKDRTAEFIHAVAPRSNSRKGGR